MTAEHIAALLGVGLLAGTNLYAIYRGEAALRAADAKRKQAVERAYLAGHADGCEESNEALGLVHQALNQLRSSSSFALIQKDVEIQSLKAQLAIYKEADRV